MFKEILLVLKEIIACFTCKKCKCSSGCCVSECEKGENNTEEVVDQINTEQ